ncbi:hypothetical protein N7462_004173 [Penicillium macrosclerotiorum]|uniref:uncharacterized protein n=1 Tax=Penicillium macrosclerotiorum TaxID=303699 RepID=UPI0025483C31|nr:uncharacterized protein N7462_004173 [Penicillium macrosclerotiorum]KAJ5689781.1 hypothetical protein N7462_004173 [Penicillium macrosclerotiorum]
MGRPPPPEKHPNPPMSPLGTVVPMNREQSNTSSPEVSSTSSGIRLDVECRELTTEPVEHPEMSVRPRRFLAQPVETTSRNSQPRSSAPAHHTEKDQNDSLPPLTPETSLAVERPRRMLPVPIETSKAHKSGTVERNRDQDSSRMAPGVPRRFKPEVLETDRRSVKGKSSEVARQLTLPTANEGLIGHVEPTQRIFHAVPTIPTQTPSAGVVESQFSYANLLRRQETRRHSFRVPTLPSIPSNSSEDSDEPSESRFARIFPAKVSQKFAFHDNTRNLFRESCDDEFSEYLLSLAARSAQKQLKEQALAAFPNEQVYQPVDHFAIDEEGRDSDGDAELIDTHRHHIKSRRQSSADLSWELEYLRQHKEEAQQRLRAMVSSSKRADLSSQGLRSTPKNNGPSPPMLGADIVLPQSLSPDGTLCEETSAENYVSRTAQDPCTDCGGLWCATNRAEDGRGTGLWMGTCRKSDEGLERSSLIMTGIMTPMLQSDDFEEGLCALSSTAPASLESFQPPRSGTSPTFSKAFGDEFHDGFVTQIYNYLSLGYPCVARFYDHELSKISGIAIEDLRRDDLCTDARGYVAPAASIVVICTRWKALRLYIHEWARQQPNMMEDENSLEAWGMPERRGSWAI